MTAQQSHYAHDVRIGPLSVFTLIVVICMAVLAVLAFSTANASLTMTQRQAEATTEMYLDESAAQQFVAGIDDALAPVREADGTGSEGVNAVRGALVSLRDAAQDASGGRVTAVASVVDNEVRAEFACKNGRTLSIVVTIRDDATFRIDKWKMTAVQNEAEPAGKLWTGE